MRSAGVDCGLAVSAVIENEDTWWEGRLGGDGQYGISMMRSGLPRIRIGFIRVGGGPTLGECAQSV